MEKEKNLKQAFDNLEKVVQSWMQKEDPEIRARLWSGKNKTYVMLEECWPEEQVSSSTSHKLDRTVAWAEEILATWPSSKRTSWDTWQFGSKKEAEKFLIMFNLLWAE